MEISEYLDDDSPLSNLLVLLKGQGTAAFFEAEKTVLDNLPQTRRSSERLMDYLREVDSVAAWETLIKNFRGFLSEDEMNEMKAKAYQFLDRKIVDKWFNS